MNCSYDACASLRQTIWHSLEASKQMIPLSQCNVNTLVIYEYDMSTRTIRVWMKCVMREHYISHTLALVIDRLFYFGGFLVHFFWPTLSAHWGKCTNARTSVNSGNHLPVCLLERGIDCVSTFSQFLLFFSKNPLTCCTAGLSALFTLENIQTSKCLFCLSKCYIKHCWWKGYVKYLSGTFNNLNVGY